MKKVRLTWAERLHNRIFIPIVVGMLALAAIVVGATLITVTEGYRARLTDQLFGQRRLTERVLHEIQEHLLLYGQTIGGDHGPRETASGPGRSSSLSSEVYHSLAHDEMAIRYASVVSPDDPSFSLLRKASRDQSATGLAVRQTPEGTAYFIEAVALLEPAGAVVVDLPLNDNLLADLGGDPGADVSLLIGGELVGSTLREPQTTGWLLAEATKPAMVDAVIGQGGHVITDCELSQRRMLFTPMVVESESVGMLVYSISLRPLIEARHRILWRGLPATGAAVFFIIVINNVFIRRVTRPVGQLAKATTAVASGNLDVQIAVVKPAGEVRLLTEAFLRMVRDLKASRRQSEEWHKKLEERVAERTEQVEQAHSALVRAGKLAALGELASGLAHELRNPLAVINMSLNYLTRKLPATEKTDQHVGMIREEIARVDKLIDNLLGFARPAEPRFRPTELGPLFEHALSLAEGDLSARSVRTVMLVSPSLPRIMVDPDQICQVLLNLILNACQAMPNGGELTLSAATVTAEQGGDEEMRIEVADTGPGIQPETLEHVFTPFFTTKSSGTGLGLSISQRIVRSHGGEMAVVSHAGKGATFVVTLPLTRG
jgi:signal transduction histidine kinase